MSEIFRVTFFYNEIFFSIKVCDLVLVIVVIVTVVIVTVVIVTVVIVTVVIVNNFSKNNLNILTTEENFDGQRFAILAMFYNENVRKNIFDM